MTTHLTWQNFRSVVIRPGENRTHRISESPLIEIFSNAEGNRMGLLLETVKSDTDLDPELSRLLMLTVEKTKSRGIDVLQIVCGKSRFFREAYLLFTAVIDRVLSDGVGAVESLHEELADLRALMDSEKGLSIERQMGLFGELMVLEQLIVAGGPGLITAWTGPFAENHDFRLSTHEFEVKTTNSRHRIHTINGLSQAEPSLKCSLTFISILLAAAGNSAGRTLPELVQHLRGLIQSKGSPLQGFNQALEATGYSDMDASCYTLRWKLRKEMALAPVDETFPAITSARLASVMGASFGRLEDLSYQVNLDTIAKEPANGLASTIFRPLVKGAKIP